MGRIVSIITGIALVVGLFAVGLLTQAQEPRKMELVPASASTNVNLFSPVAFTPRFNCHYNTNHGSKVTRLGGSRFSMAMAIGTKVCYDRVIGVWTIEPRFGRGSYWKSNGGFICRYLPSKFDKLVYTIYFSDATGRNQKKTFAVDCKPDGSNTRLVWFRSEKTVHYYPGAGPVKARVRFKIDMDGYNDKEGSFDKAIRLTKR